MTSCTMWNPTLSWIQRTRLNVYILMPLSPDTVSKGILFSGRPILAFVYSFGETDIVTTISHECLEQF